MLTLITYLIQMARRSLDLSWEIKNNKFISKFESDTFESTKLRYYGKSNDLLDCKKALLFYSHIKNTNFPTLYAPTNPFDYFAESFANYIHTIVLKRPWKLNVYFDNKSVSELTSCWNQTRCKDKKIVLEKILKIPN